MVHEEIKHRKYGKIIRFFRKNILLFISLLIAFAWPKAKYVLESAMFVANDGDIQAAASDSAWLPMGNPMSKLILTIVVFCIMYIIVWFALKRTQPALKEWAKDEFTKTFKTLDPKWQHIIFAAYWLGPLLVFALLWMGSANVV